MKKIFLGLGLGVIALLVLYVFIFGDRRAKLKVGHEGSAYNESVFQTTAFSPTTTDRYLVKNARLSFEVRDVGAVRDSIQRLAALFEGYVSSETQATESGRIHFSQTVKVPSNMIDELTRRIERLASRVESRVSSAVDVTEEYVDLQSRLVTKRRIEARLHEIVNRANNVEELLKVETQLGMVRGEIESIEGKLKLLNNQISFGTLTLHFYEPGGNTEAFGYRLSTSLADGWNGMLTVLSFLAMFWPLVILTVLVSVLYLIRRNRQAQSFS